MSSSTPAKSEASVTKGPNVKDETDSDSEEASKMYGWELSLASGKSKPPSWDRRKVLRFDPRYWDLGFFAAKFRKKPA